MLPYLITPMYRENALLKGTSLGLYRLYLNFIVLAIMNTELRLNVIILAYNLPIPMLSHRNFPFPLIACISCSVPWKWLQ